MFGKTEYSDATIIIYGVELPVHKVILCMQSEKMKELFDKNPNKEKPNVLTVDKGSGAAYWRIIEYIYTGNYSDEIPNGLKGEKPCLFMTLYVF
jgi:hypothetical protein